MLLHKTQALLRKHASSAAAGSDGMSQEQPTEDVLKTSYMESGGPIDPTSSEDSKKDEPG